jgi:hypothetical protein
MAIRLVRLARATTAIPMMYATARNSVAGRNRAI